MDNYSEKSNVVQAESFTGPDWAIEVGGVISQADIRRYSMSVDHCDKCGNPLTQHGRMGHGDEEVMVCPGNFVVKDKGEFKTYRPTEFFDKYDKGVL